MLRVGLTGNIGSGKSTVARIWSEFGARVIDADRIAREVLSPGSTALERVTRVFGRKILDEAGSLDRKRLSSIVFSDPTALTALNEIVHPLIIERIQEIIEQESAVSNVIFVVEAALILECGLEDSFDVIVVVDADPAECVARISDERGLRSEEVVRITEFQMRRGKKKLKGDFVVDNIGNLDELREKAVVVYEALQQMEVESHK